MRMARERKSPMRSLRIAHAFAAVSFLAAAAVLQAQTPAAPATAPRDSDRPPPPAPVPAAFPQATFFVHRLGTDHAEGITTLDMNGDGRPDLLSGAYWYENPGPQGGEWKRHQYREAESQRIRLRLRRVDHRREPRRLS